MSFHIWDLLPHKIKHFNHVLMVQKLKKMTLLIKKNIFYHLFKIYNINNKVLIIESNPLKLPIHNFLLVGVNEYWILNLDYNLLLILLLFSSM